MSEIPAATVPVNAGRAGCGCAVRVLAAIVVLGVVTGVSLVIYMQHTDEAKKFHRWNGMLMKDLRVAFGNYLLDYSHFPIAGTTTPNADLALRSRGPLLPVLLGENVAGLNPKKLKYIDLPVAKDHKRGLWQEGDECVLSDSYGEPFYIVLDTTGDGKTANPEFGADKFDAKYAARYREFPPPAELPVDVIIYSAGKDRDPKTWLDNICSWRQR